MLGSALKPSAGYIIIFIDLIKCACHFDLYAVQGFTSAAAVNARYGASYRDERQNEQHHMQIVHAGEPAR